MPSAHHRSSQLGSDEPREIPDERLRFGDQNPRAMRSPFREGPMNRRMRLLQLWRQPWQPVRTASNMPHQTHWKMEHGEEIGSGVRYFPLGSPRGFAPDHLLCDLVM